MTRTWGPRRWRPTPKEEEEEASGHWPLLPTGLMTMPSGKPPHATNHGPASRARVPPPAWVVKAARRGAGPGRAFLAAGRRSSRGAAATQREEAIAKANRFRKEVKKPPLVSA